MSFPSDSRNRKGIVALVYILEMTQVALCSYDAFRVFSTGWGNIVELDSIGLYWLDYPILTGLSEYLTVGLILC